MKRYQIVMTAVLLAALLPACSKKSGEPATEKTTENMQETVQPETRKPIIQIQGDTETSAALEPGGVSDGQAAGAAGGAEAAGAAGTTGATASSETKTALETKPVKAETRAVKETEAPKVYAVSAFEKTMYATASVNVRASYTTKSEVVSGLSAGQKVQVTGKSENGWLRIICDGRDAYVYQKYLSESPQLQKVEEPKTTKTPGNQPSGNPQPQNPSPGTIVTPGGTSAGSHGPAVAPGEILIVEPAPVGNSSGTGGPSPVAGPGA